MKQSIFEIRQRADELLKEASAIWSQSNLSDNLEELGKDPVFEIIMRALAYQEVETDSEMERFRQDIFEDFSRLLTPFEAGHAVPASVLVATAVKENISEVFLNQRSVFTAGENIRFLPLCRSRIINARLSDFERLDGRRWKVVYNLPHPISGLSDLSFSIDNSGFRGLNLTLKNRKLQLVRPWNYSELPFVKCFNESSLIYNLGEYYSPSMLPLDLFARQQKRVFWIKSHPAGINWEELTQLEFIFEFTGTIDNFVFKKEQLALNTAILVNASIDEVTVSSLSPIARLVGSSAHQNGNSLQFLHLLRPSDSILNSNTNLEVRRVGADRFNLSSLVRLLNTVVNKYHTDFYAYQNMQGKKSDMLIYNLQQLVSNLWDISRKESADSMPGVYLLLQDREKMKNPNFSLTVNYLVTDGAGANRVLNSDMRFETPGGLSSDDTRPIANPVPGLDEVRGDTANGALLKYYLLTGDRIVTPADIKIFCKKELFRDFSIPEELIYGINVDTSIDNDSRSSGYVILVEILMAGSNLIKKNFADKIPAAELMLQKMIEVRTSGIYPVRVVINILGQTS